MSQRASILDKSLNSNVFNNDNFDLKADLPFEGSKALDQLIMENRDSARKIAHSLLRRWRVALPLDEIESLVDLTLCEAANRYSPDQGASFMTFFFYYVWGNLARNIGKLARISQYFVTPGNSLDSLSSAVTNKLYLHVLHQEHWTASGEESNAPEQLLLSRERVFLCNKALNKLDAVDREVLLRLYDGDESLVDIARTLGYSRCHISRIKKRALRQFQATFAEVSEIRDNRKHASDERQGRKRRGRHRRDIAPTLLQRTQLGNDRQCT